MEREAGAMIPISIILDCSMATAQEVFLALHRASERTGAGYFFDAAIHDLRVGFELVYPGEDIWAGRGNAEVRFLPEQWEPTSG